MLVLWLLLFARAFVVDNLFAWSAGVVYLAYDTALLAFVFRQTWPLRRAPGPSATPVPLRLGVLVAAHNEAAVLPATLAALAAQSEPAEEIVIVDDGSTDATAAMLAARYGLVAPALGELSAASPSWPALRWLRLPHGGKALALNAALERGTTEVVMTVDADTLLDPGGIAAMRRAFGTDPKLVAATGVLIPVCGPSVGGRIMQFFQRYEYVRNFLSRYAWGRLDALLLISGAFAGFRRAAVLEVGGFDGQCLVEDYELIHRLRRHGTRAGLGWRTAVLGDARARTEAPSTMGGFLRQRRRWFGGFVQTQYWYRDMVGDRRYGWLGVALLPVKAIDTLQPLYGLLGAVLLVWYFVTGHSFIIAPIFGVIGAKIVIDLAFHLWSIHLYRRWVGAGSGVSIPAAILASFIEPFSFQLLRHLGAALGWVMLFTGERGWGAQARLGLATPAADPVR